MSRGGCSRPEPSW
eukprot:gene25922-biopygen17874